jgi:hypothetical protein
MANTPWRFVDCVADHIAGLHDLGDLTFCKNAPDKLAETGGRPLLSRTANV